MNIEIFVTNFEDFDSRPKVSNPIDEKKDFATNIIRSYTSHQFSMLRDLA